MDGGSLCQPHAAAITPAAMMDGREGKGGERWGGQGRESQSGASITPLNLPVTARALMKEGGGREVGLEGRRRRGGASASLRLLVKGLFRPPLELEFVRSLFGDPGPEETRLIECRDRRR